MSQNSAQQAEKFFAQMRAGNLAGAAKTAQTAMKRFPKDPRFANFAGMALAQAGRERDAAVHFAKALKLAPGNEDVRQNLIKALIGAGEFDAAMTRIETAVDKAAKPLPYLVLRALLEFRRDAFEAAVAAATQALEVDPDHVEALKLRASALRDMHLNAAAIEDFQKARALAPMDLSLPVAMALPLDRELRVDEALACLAEAVAMDPSHIDSRFRYAQQLANANRIIEARTQYQDILKIEPDHPGALEGLAEIGGDGDDATLLARIDAAIGSARKSPFLPALHFGAARLSERLGQTGAALRHFAAANAAKARLTPYDPQFAEREFDLVMDSARTIPTGDVEGPGGPRPIFIVGQPRSGTTLTEMILTTPPSVLACGEVGAAGILMLPHIRDGKPFDPVQFGQDLIARMPAAIHGHAAFVDKMPHNYMFLPHLAAALPDARLVHLERDPRDVAWSMWRANMSGARQAFSYDMKAMAHHANLYRRYMTAWHEMLGDRVFTLRYEDLVQDLEANSRALAAFCGLDWSEAMLSPETNAASVRTASLTQVRQKVHTKSVGGWRAHQDQLAPFMAALDPNLWPECFD